MSCEFFFIRTSVLSTRYSALSSYDFIRSRQHIRRDRQADLLRRFQVDYQLELRGSFDRNFGRFGSLQDFIDQGGYACVAFRLVEPIGTSNRPEQQILSDYEWMAGDVLRLTRRSGPD